MAVVQLLHLRHLALWFPLEAVDSYGSVVRNLEEHISVPRWVGEGVVEGSPPTSQVPVEKLVESHMVIVVHQNARIGRTLPRNSGHRELQVWLNFLAREPSLTLASPGPLEMQLVACSVKQEPASS